MVHTSLYIVPRVAYHGSNQQLHMKSPNGKCLVKFEFVKKFELVECRKSRKIDGKSMSIPNREGVHKMYR